MLLHNYDIAAGVYKSARQFVQVFCDVVLVLAACIQFSESSSVTGCYIVTTFSVYRRSGACNVAVLNDN